MDSLIHNYIKFVDVLRLIGIRVSISESIDGLNGLQYLDIKNKSCIKICLSSLLAKGEEEKKLFDSAFEKYFILPHKKEEFIETEIKNMQNKKMEVQEAAKDLLFQDEQLEMKEELQGVYKNLSAEEKKSISKFLEKTSEGKNVKKEFKLIVEKMLSSKLEKLKNKNIDQYEKTSYSNNDLINTEAGLIANDIKKTNNANSLENKNIGSFTEDEIPKAIILIRRLTMRVNKEIKKKHKYTTSHKRLDIKKTINKNIGMNGVLFKLAYKQKVRKKSKIIIICDISASMYRFSGFVLEFLKGISLIEKQMENYVFSEGFERLNLMDFISSTVYEEKIKNSELWRKGTNINKLLKHLLLNSNNSLKPSTILLIISDGKTMEHERAIKNLRRINKKIKKTIWFNPIPENRWDKSIKMFKNETVMLDCSTLERLSEACNIL
jgi:uncharacterized protein with von Willebrand factor type A (vWA) domain